MGKETLLSSPLNLIFCAEWDNVALSLISADGNRYDEEHVDGNNCASS